MARPLRIEFAGAHYHITAGEVRGQVSHRTSRQASLVFGAVHTYRQAESPDRGRQCPAALLI